MTYYINIQTYLNKPEMIAKNVLYSSKTIQPLYICLLKCIFWPTIFYKMFDDIVTHDLLLQTLSRQTVVTILCWVIRVTLVRSTPPTVDGSASAGTLTPRTNATVLLEIQISFLKVTWYWRQTTVGIQSPNHYFGVTPWIEVCAGKHATFGDALKTTVRDAT